MKEATIRQLVREELVREIGETTETFDWKLMIQKDFGVRYAFQTPNHTYEVGVEKFTPDYMAVEFGVKTGMGPETDYEAVTDEGQQFKVVATVLDIARHAWENRDKLFDDSYWPGVKGFALDAADESGRDKNARRALYRRFIEKQFPRADVSAEGDTMLYVDVKR